MLYEVKCIRSIYQVAENEQQAIDLVANYLEKLREDDSFTSYESVAINMER